MSAKSGAGSAFAMYLYVSKLAHVEEAADPDSARGQAHLDSPQSGGGLAIHKHLDFAGASVIHQPHLVPLLLGQSRRTLEGADSHAIAAKHVKHAIVRLGIGVVVGEVDVVKVIRVAIGVNEN